MSYIKANEFNSSSVQPHAVDSARQQKSEASSTLLRTRSNSPARSPFVFNSTVNRNSSIPISCFVTVAQSIALK